MKAINIVRPAGGNHSAIFIEIAELIYFALREMGNLVLITPGEFRTNCKNIVIGIFYGDEFFSQLPEDSIILNTEALFSEHPQTQNWTSKLLQIANRFPIWDYNQRNIEKLKDCGIDGVKLFEFGYQKELERIPYLPNSERYIDVLFYGSINDRRKELFQKIEARGLKFVHLFGVYGQERDFHIAKSRIVLNAHFYSQEIFEVVRVHYLLNNAVAVVAEINPTTSVEPRFLNLVNPSIYSDIPERCSEMVGNIDQLESFRIKALEEFRKYPQVDYMNRLLDSL